MTYPFALRVLLATVLGSSAITVTAGAADHHLHRHVRAPGGQLDGLVHEGLRASETFRRIVARLAETNVVVYLEFDGAMTPAGGRLSFVSAAGGYRYLRVRISFRLPSRQQIAIIGHELQHAVEVADAPEVVDGASLALAFARIGYVNPRAGRHAFDTEAAVRVGYRIMDELTGAAANPPESPASPGGARLVRAAR